MLHLLLAALAIYVIVWTFKQKTTLKNSFRMVRRAQSKVISNELNPQSVVPEKVVVQPVSRVIAHKKHEHLANRNEQKLYFALQSILPETYVIHCQVSMMALVSPVDFKHNAKVWAKRMDYVITDRSTKIIAVIELDDASHHSQQRLERDKYVKEVLNTHHNFIRISTRKYYDPMLIANLLEQKAGIKCV